MPAAGEKYGRRLADARWGGRHWLKGYSRTQAVVALSSAESELYGAVRAATKVMGLVSMFGGFG